MTRRRVDVHSHFVPDFYREALLEAGQDHPDGIKGIPEWSEDLAIQTMDRLDVELSILSISSPGVHFGDSRKAADLARALNEEGARLCERNPGRFGFFATLPLPDVDAAVSELRYSLDVLRADGIVLETNHHGVYLGDPRLEPIYAEVSSRSSVAFIHPTSPPDAGHLALGYPRPMLEFMFETTRSVTNMILSGVLERHSDARVIVPHAGAALAVLANRVELLLPLLAAPGDNPPPSIRRALRQLHFDLAGAPVDELLTALLSVADPKRIHYGSDFPFTPADACADLAALIENTKVLADELRDDIYRGNSEILLSRGRT
ncbi:MAG: 6-methylsalicylate decarboxylase [Pseudonocardia sp.]